MAGLRRWRISLRYLRWAIKAAFLLLFIVPIAYVPASSEWEAPIVPVTSITFPPKDPFFFLPITQSPCSIWLHGYCNIDIGAWILCPLGGVQALLTGRVATFRVVQTVAAILLFVILTVLLGNVFCSWVCPIGTVVDSFDKGIEKFFPKIEAKRAERLRRRREDKHESHGSLGCPLCPMSKIMSKIIYNRNGILANGILASVLVGSFALKFNVFCLVCPIGILSKGFLHLKAVLYTVHGYITSAINFVILIEIWILPVAAVLVSIRMKRYFCRKLCPLGVFFSGVGALNPFIKPKVKHEKCVMKGCPDDCEDYHLDYCGFCRSMDARKCEKVCPVDINLVDNGSLHRCTKCMECYIACDRGAIKINFIAKPDFFRVSSFLRRLKKSVGARINKKGKVAFTEEIGDECR